MVEGCYWRYPLVKAKLYLEGGGDSNALNVACRRAFRILMERAGFKGRMPRLVASGSRENAYHGFRAEHESSSPDAYVALLVDSEEPVRTPDRPWKHLEARDGWPQPPGASQEQVLLMITCMETWLSADRKALRTVFGPEVNEGALPSVHGLESRSRQDVQNALKRATAQCRVRYAKGVVSFRVLEHVSSDTLRETTSLSAFRRFLSVLDKNLRDV